MDLYKIDVTGDDIFNKGYGIIVLYNNKQVYGYKFSSEMQSEIRNNFKGGCYGFSNSKIIKPRVYCAVLSLILKQVSEENQTHDEEFDLHLCNDFDGHQHDIIQFLKDITKNMLIFKDISTDNYHFTKHPKKSKIQKFSLQLSKGDWTEINKVKIDERELHKLIAKKKAKKKW